LDYRRAEIMAAFNDINQVVGKVGPFSYMSGRLAGFKIGSIPDKSILKKIGLGSHDRILALNNKPIKGENGAFEFFEQIAEGKKVTIKYRRRNRTRRIELNPI
jgi:type II secretory pathway component PulC